MTRAVPPTFLLRDDGPIGNLYEGVVSVYVDNVRILTDDEGRGRELHQMIHAEIQRAGLETHEVACAEPGGTLLALQISSDGVLSPEPARRWRL